MEAFSANYLKEKGIPEDDFVLLHNPDTVNTPKDQRFEHIAKIIKNQMDGKMKIVILDDSNVHSFPFIIDENNRVFSLTNIPKYANGMHRHMLDAGIEFFISV